MGQELLSVNEISAQDLIEFAIIHYPSDGDNLTHKMQRFKNPSWFSDMLTIMSTPTEKYKLEIGNMDDGLKHDVIIYGITKDSVNSLMENQLPPIEFKILTETPAALLTIRSFSVRDFIKSNIKYNAFLQESFMILNEKKVENLILDFRGNGGGEDEFGRLLYSYFCKANFKYYSSLTIAKDKFNFFEYVEGGQRTMPDDFAVKNEYGTFDVTKKYNSNVGTHQPLTPQFTGNIFVLIDGGCFSTTSELLSQLYANTNAQFIGEESGGNYFTNNSGIVAELILPNSQLRVSIPMLKYVYNVPDTYPHKKNGIVPQHVVNQSPNDIVNNTDTVLEYTLKLIKM